MSEKRFRIGLDDVYFNCIEDFVFDTEVDCMIDNAEVLDLLNEQQATINRQSEQHKQILNELINENSELRMKIVSLENEVQRQNNELKNTRKGFIKKTDELNWLKSEDYLKKIY